MSEQKTVIEKIINLKSQALGLTAALLIADSLQPPLVNCRNLEAAAAVVQVDSNYEEGKQIAELSLGLNSSEVDEKDKGVRNSVRGFTKETLNILQDLRQVLKNFNIRTKPAREDLINKLDTYYNKKIPEPLKRRIAKAIDFLQNFTDDVVEGTRDGVKDFRTEQARKKLQDILFNPFHKINERTKDNLKIGVLTPEDIQAEFARVTHATNARAKPDQNLDNPTNGNQI